MADSRPSSNATASSAAAAHRPSVNRQWVLRERPVGRLARECFECREALWQAPALDAGEILVRNLVFQCAPTIRNWMNDASRSYRASIGLGEPVVGPACVEVVQSAHPRYLTGSRLIAVSRWEDYTALRPDGMAIPAVPVPISMSPVEALGVYGYNSLTAYFGLVRVARALAGETLLVTAAAGSVGSVALQIGRIIGCRAIGVAGGPEKCAWLREACGAEDVIDYKAEDLDERLADLAPAGVDVMFDNVGGLQLAAAIRHMAPHGRIAVCGQVSAYDGDAPAPGPPDMMRVVYGRLRIEGFVTGDFLKEADATRDEMARWVGEGRLLIATDVRHGFEQLPAAFVELFRGANRGTLLVTADR
jgi:NADPH-dependent curcumin reductase CurA